MIGRVRRIASATLLAWLLLGCAPVWAEAFLQFLALKGDGTGSVIIDRGSNTAIIHDGGRAESGITGAEIDGVSVLQYLSRPELNIQHLVISCSHPHADHIDGLKTLVTNPQMAQFASITFIDTVSADVPGTPKNPDSLYDLYRASNQGGGAAVKHELLLQDGKIRSLETVLTDLRMTNYSYRPGDIGEKVHDSAIINEYTLTGARGESLSVVDFDDASKKLIRRWATDKKAVARARNERVRLQAVVLSHHGSRYNDMSPVLDVNSGIEVHSVIATANEGNQFLHPHPEALVQAVRKVGPNRVFITGSQAGDNVVITAHGVTVSGGERAARERLEALLAAREARDRAVMDGNALVAKRLQARRDFLGVQDVREAIAEKGEGLPGSAYDDGVMSFAAIAGRQGVRQRSSETQTDGDDRKDRHSGLPGLNGEQGPDVPAAPITNPRPPEKPPGGAPALVALPSASVSGGAPGARGPGNPPLSSGGGAAANGGGSPRGGGAGSGSGAGGYVTFNNNLAEIAVEFGGVLIGNEPHGPAAGIEQITYESEDPDSVRVTVAFKDGLQGDYGPISRTELWAAYNFIQPTPELQAKYPGATLIGDAAGLAGMVHRAHFGDEWVFAINPAIANTSIARDVMRFDMAVSVASDGNGSLPKAVSSLPWGQIGDFVSYQWYDDPAEILVSNGRVQVVRAKDHDVSCLMRLRLISDPHASNFQQRLKAREATDSEISRRVAEIEKEEPHSIEERAALYEVVGAQVESEYRKKLTSTPVATGITDPICRGLPFIRTINSLAATVALLHLYRDQFNGALPTRVPTLKPRFERVEARMSETQVFAQ